MVVEMEQSGVDVSRGAGGGAVGTGVDVGVEGERGSAEDAGRGAREPSGRRGKPEADRAVRRRRSRARGGRERRPDSATPAAAAAAVVAPSRGQRGVFPPHATFQHGRRPAGGSVGGAAGHGGEPSDADAGVEEHCMI